MMFSWPCFRKKKKTTGSDEKPGPQESVNILKDPRPNNGVPNTSATSATINSAVTEKKEERAKRPPWWRRWCVCFSKKNKVHILRDPKNTSTDTPAAETGKDKAKRPPWWLFCHKDSAAPPAKTATPAAKSLRLSAGNNTPRKKLTQQQLACLGLPNLAQTCYMNSTLQSLLCLKTFNQEIHNQREIWSSTPAANLIRAFVDIGLSRSSSMSHKLRALITFKRIVSAKAAEFHDDGQKDAHEFLSCVLQQLRFLSTELQGVAAGMGRTYTCPVESCLSFQMQSTRTCKGCGKQSLREEDFTMLSLDLVPADSVEQSLQRYLMENQLEFRCKCGADTSRQQWSFLTLPNVLVLHLKRFRVTPSWTLEKVRDPVLLSRELTLAGIPSASEETDAGTESSRPMDVCRYTLLSVLSHLGHRVDFGHYVSDGVYSEEQAGEHTDRWLSYSDEEVDETTGKAVCRLREKTAYLLFYEKQQ